MRKAWLLEACEGDVSFFLGFLLISKQILEFWNLEVGGFCFCTSWNEYFFLVAPRIEEVQMFFDASIPEEWRK